MSTFRITFEIDPDGTFEECNGEPRPLSAREYRANSYRACPDHPRAGSTTIAPATNDRPPVTGCRACGRPGSQYRTIPYAEYLAYYGNPDRHVYVYAYVDRQCASCDAWHATAASLGHIDLMDTDRAEVAAIDRTYLETEADQIPGYLGEVARELFDEARETPARETTLSAIAGVLDRREWSPDTPERIAEILRAAGYEIREP